MVFDISDPFKPIEIELVDSNDTIVLRHELDLSVDQRLREFSQ